MAVDYAKRFAKRLHERFPFIKPLESYKAMKVQISLICTKPWCGNEWDTSTPDNILNKSKHGCPSCNMEQQNIKWKEDTLKWLKEERQDIELMSPLTQYDDPHDWVCTSKECMHRWSVDFNSIRGANSGCPKCGIRKNAESRSISKDEFEKWLKTNRPFIRLIKYSNQSTNAIFFCTNPHHVAKEDNDREWETLPEILRLQGRGLEGCPACGSRKSGVLQRIPESEVREWMELNKPDIKMLDGYIDTNSRFNCLCKKCNYPFPGSYSQFKNNDSGCPQCAGVARVTEEDFLKRLFLISKNTIELWGEYTGYSHDTDFKCLKNGCGHIWTAKPVRLTSGQPTKCPACTEGGFDLRRPGWLYLMKKEGEQQFGITNTPAGRIKFHQRDGYILVELRGPYSGEKALKKEAELKTWLKTSIGLHIKGKKENWPTNRAHYKDFNALFIDAGINPIPESELIEELDVCELVVDNNLSMDYPSEWDDLPKSQLEAMNCASTRFFNKKLCRQGHLSPRFASGSCCECLNNSQREIGIRNKEERIERIISANEWRDCANPKCNERFLMTPEMYQDRIFCSKKCAGAESKENYVNNNPELVKTQKRRSYEKRKQEQKMKKLSD